MFGYFLVFLFLTSYLSSWIYIYIYIYIHIYIFESFFTPASDSKSPQISRILLNILTDFHKFIVWMISAYPLISSNPFTNPLGIVPSAPITIGINATFMFHSFFSSLAKSRYLSPSTLPCGQPGRQSPLFSGFSLFFFFFFVDYL